MCSLAQSRRPQGQENLPRSPCPRPRPTGAARNWLCFARLPAGNADLRIGLVAEIGFVLSWHFAVRMRHNSVLANDLTAILPPPKLALFRTFRCHATGGSLKASGLGDGLLCLRETDWVCLYSAPRPLSSKPRPAGSAGNWLCFARSAKPPNWVCLYNGPWAPGSEGRRRRWPTQIGFVSHHRSPLVSPVLPACAHFRICGDNWLCFARLAPAAARPDRREIGFVCTAVFQPTTDYRLPATAFWLSVPVFVVPYSLFNCDLK